MVDMTAMVAGSTGSGKSMLLIQAVNYCAEKNWVVLYVPRGTVPIFA